MKAFKTVVAVGAVMASVALYGCPPPGSGGAAAPADGAIKVEFFVMAQCPYGVQVENAIAPVLTQLGTMVDFKLDFIGNGDATSGFKSLHGDNEVQGDIAQLCALKHSPAKYFDMVVCMNKDARQIPNNWESCAGSSGVDTGSVKSCLTGAEGKQLLTESFDRANKAGARGSPTIKINGKPYSGGRSQNAFMRSICNEYDPAKRPQACSSVPPPVPVALTVLNDQRCQDCTFKAQRFVARLKMDIPGLTVKDVDYMTDEGKKMFTENGIKMLPVFIFDANVEKEEEARRYMMRMRKVSDNYLMEVGDFDPKAEICDNGKDDNNDGKVDCADPTCSDTLTCRKEEKGKLELFIMSQCPYGVRALNSMQEVLGAIPKDKVSFSVHFIADEAEAGKFKSLHGDAEVEEDIRQLCAAKYFGKGYKFMDYVLCRNKNIRDANWESCASKETGVDAAVIKRCVTSGEGTRLMTEDIKLSKKLKIGASPTWIANGKNQFSGIAANDIKSNFCKFNNGMAGCDKQLSQDNSVQGGCGTPQ
jgi:predicted DsbA family dithiol-disulfide isomerase